MKRLLMFVLLVGGFLPPPLACSEPARPGQTSSPPIQHRSEVKPAATQKAEPTEKPAPENKKPQSQPKANLGPDKPYGQAISFKGKRVLVLPQAIPSHLLAPATDYQDRQMVLRNWSDLCSQIPHGVDWMILSLGHSNGIYQTAIDMRGSEVIYRSLASGPAGDHFLPLRNHPKESHGHLGVFKAEPGSANRTEWHWSKEYDCSMYDAIRIWSGHFVHAALEEVYWQLGRPRSHGCGRNEPKPAHDRLQRVGRTKPFFIVVTDDMEIARALNLRDQSRLSRRHSNPHLEEENARRAERKKKEKGN